MSSLQNSDDEGGEQVRISLTLASECQDKTLEVASLPIAVPADVGRKGLSAVVNHLLDRTFPDDDDDDDDDGDGVVDEQRLSAIPFDFIVGARSGLSSSSTSGKRLLRTGIEREARRSGLSLEEAIPVTYFPALEAPELTSDESELLPDWISAMSFVDISKTNSGASGILFTGCYDGSMSVFRAGSGRGTSVLEKMVSKASHRDAGGGIKCIDAISDDSVNERAWVATGSMDHTLQIHNLDTSTFDMHLFANCKDGHTAAVGSVDLYHRSNHNLLASGDWDGAVCIWDYSEQPTSTSISDDQEQPIKKTKTGKQGSSSKKTEGARRQPNLLPKVSIQAHSSKVSGLSWGNYEKFNRLADAESSMPRLLLTGSWDHSLKVWDVERQDCLLTLNGARVVSCLDTSYHSTGIVATGHPDCTVRLWDTRTSEDAKESSLMTTVSDNTFRPSHKEWISSIKWSRQNPYHLASTSHDGTVKLWDIRSPLPLHTIRTFPKSQKGLSLAYGGDDNGFIYAGGTDCVVKEFKCTRTTAKENETVS